MMLRDNYGATIEERLEQIPSSLGIDAVALWYVVSDGWQGFGLREDALTDFVRRGILALLQEGAKPVVPAAKGWRGWVAVDYGGAPDAIADAIVKEWLSNGGVPHSDPRGLWFALPSMIRG